MLLLLVPPAHGGRQGGVLQPPPTREVPEICAAVHGTVHPRQHLGRRQQAGRAGAGGVLQPVRDARPGRGQRQRDDGQQQQQHHRGHGPQQPLPGEPRPRAQVLLQLLAAALQPVDGAGLLEGGLLAGGERRRAVLGGQQLLLVRVRRVLGARLGVLVLVGGRVPVVVHVVVVGREGLALRVGVGVGRGRVGGRHGHGRGVAVGLLVLLLVLGHVGAHCMLRAAHALRHCTAPHCTRGRRGAAGRTRCTDRPARTQVEEEPSEGAMAASRRRAARQVSSATPRHPALLQLQLQPGSSGAPARLGSPAGSSPAGSWSGGSGGSPVDAASLESVRERCPGCATPATGGGCRTVHDLGTESARSAHAHARAVAGGGSTTASGHARCARAARYRGQPATGGGGGGGGGARSAGLR